MAGISLSGDWAQAGKILRKGPMKMRVAIDRAVMAEAQLFRKMVVEGFRTQSPGGKKFEPLKETTLAMRRFKGFRGTKALNVRGDLRNSIKVVKDQTPNGVEAFVGVLKSARSKDGKSLINIAEVMEFGSRPILINVTPAMRRFLAMVFRKELPGFGTTGDGGGLSRGIIIVKIPARPFIRPVADAAFKGPKAAARYKSRVITNFGSLMGTARNASISAAVRSSIKNPKEL